MEDLTVWEMEKVKQSWKGYKTYSYWMASRHESGKTRNVHLGSCRKMDAAQARQKAREKKAEALGMLALVERQPMQNCIAFLYIEAEMNQCFNFAPSRETGPC